MIRQNWAGAWINYDKYLYGYDASNNKISAVFQSWNASSSSWLKTQTNSINYDVNHFMKNFTRKFYDNTSGVNITNEDSTAIYFHTVVGINELGNKTLFSIYPNPSKGIFNLSSSNDINFIEVYNKLGTLVSKPEISYNNQIDLTNLSSGLYFLKVSDGKQYHTEKIIIE